MNMTGYENVLTYHDYVQGIRTLTPEEQLSLIEAISENLKSALRGKHVVSPSKFAHLKRRKLIVGDPDELVDIKVGEWSEQQNL
jgi:hypothetical protein